MVKSLLLTAAAITAFSFSGFSWIKYERYNRGIFGYKYVNTSTTGPNTLVSCSDPGWSGCRKDNGITTGVVTDANGTVRPIDDIEPIVEAVTARITKESTEGTMYYGSDLFVKYSYKTEGDRFVMEVYSLYEARALGYIR
ncbi:hypothetical protein D3C87_431340 [compost metagenome]